LFGSALLAATIESATARPASAVLHEPIPRDAREDLSLNASPDDDLPSVLTTTTGVVGEADPHPFPRPTESTYGYGGPDTFAPDRDTRRPEAGSYDDPFTPPTAPFKRLHAYDAVSGEYRLYVRNEQRVEVPIGGVSPGPNDDAFYADLTVEVGHDRIARIPSVGPGAHIVRAHLAVGEDKLLFRVTRDGADNWFLQAGTAGVRLRARLVMELAVPRAALGGKLADPSWSDLPRIQPLPVNVAREAAAVRSAIGIERTMRPREAMMKMVEYFRSFAESNDPPVGRGSIYLDLALSKKGVCRHRAFAFLVTAQSMGIPTRLITNEAHAWVEVYDATLWHRVDLGGAAPIVTAASSVGGNRAPYEHSANVPSVQNDDRSADLGTGLSAHEYSLFANPRNDDRPLSLLSLAIAASDAHRGQPLRLRGDVRADGEPCPRVGVELWLRTARTQRGFLLGKLATGDDGVFADDLVISSEVPLGEYEVVARTSGGARCGPGSSN
jgi:transglutaminase-like putative cysteine protease